MSLENFQFLSEKAEELKEMMNRDFDGVDSESLMEELNNELRALDEEFDNYHPKLYLGYKKLNSDAVTPKYNYEGDSGFDLYSTEEIVIGPLGRALVPTGIALDIKDGYEVQVRSKSGLAINEGLFVLNSPGTVDCFSEDMRILTVDGEKTISELKINDIIFSVNEKTFEVEKDTISHIFNTDIQEVLIIETELGVLEVTPNSEVYTTQGIILAKNLKENDEIIVF